MMADSEMSPLSAWLVILAFTIVFVVGAALFRARKLPLFEQRYRDASLPALWRNLPIVSPLGAMALAPAVILLVPAVFGIALEPVIPRRIIGVIIFSGFAWTLGITGLACLFGLNPPRWLLPRWLLDENAAIHFQPIRPTGFDLLFVPIGVALLVLSLGLIGVAAYWAVVGG